MYNTGQPTLDLEFQERLDNWACCSVAASELAELKYYDFLIVSFALLLNRSTTPLESMPLAHAITHKSE